MAVDFLTIVNGLKDTVAIGGPFWTLVTVVSWVAGACFGYLAILQLKQVGDNQRQGLRAPIMSFIAGSAMISSPELIRSVLLTTMGDGMGTEPLSYIVDKTGSNQSLAAVLQMVTFMGYVFFIRGIWVLKESGEPQRYANSTVAKAVCILGAGMAAIYIDFTLKTLATSFGFNISAYIS